MQEEQFGPLVPIATWSSVQEVEDYVMSSHYGQQATTPASRNTPCNRACPCRKRESNHARRAIPCYCFYCFSGADLAPRVVLVCAGGSVFEGHGRG
jgi:hypothetical protein